MTNSPTIAGVILTLNEETDLKRALDSLAWCDELLVVDSGSTDRTLQIAAQNGAVVLQNIQSTPFLITEQRNWVLDNAGLQSDWILFLDADEEVGLKLKQDIVKVLSIDNHLNAYELAPRYWFLGRWLKHTQGFPNWHPRLVRKGSARFTGGVWETFNSSALVGRIYTPYEHYAFSKGIGDWLIKHLRYATWDAKTTFDVLTSKRFDDNLQRKKYWRLLFALAWPLRPAVRFIHKYVICGGFLDGWQGLLFCSLMSAYELIVVVKIIEKKRHYNQLPL